MEEGEGGVGGGGREPKRTTREGHHALAHLCARFLGVQGRDCHGYHLETKAFTFHPPVFSVISRVTSIGL